VDPSGKIGSITDNYFDLPAYRTLNTLPIEDGPIPGTVFGYMLPESQLPTGIYEDLDGDPASEGDLVAWWDGENWRYGQDQNFAIVPDSQLADWAARPLSEDEVLPGPRYEAAVIDDLRAVNMDFFIYLGENAVTSDADGFDPASITVRIIAEPAVGADDPLWTQAGNEAPSLDSYATDSDTSTAVGGGGGGGCTIGGNRPFDPLLPGLALAALGYLGLRRRWNA
uniref:choice-of-anchor F family protein n=1 Tax=Thioalkalivibrio sp. TaxID=2093813 RepID=UPI003561E480